VTEFLDRSLSALVAFLRGAYPVTARLLGEPSFGAAALAFALRHAPVCPVPVAYGGDFAGFLAEQFPIGDALHLADVATLERLWTEAHLAADAPVLGHGELPKAEGDWATHRLPLHPATGFIWLKTPAVTVWQAHQKGHDAVAPEFRAEGALVTRSGGRVALRSISRPEHRMLSGLRLGEDVGQAAEAMTALYPEADVASVLTDLVSSGAFAGSPDIESNER
jgi:hypothetical protein